MSYWYFITTYACPLCGKTEVHRERRYTPRPDLPLDRHEYVEHACGTCRYQ